MKLLLICTAILLQCIPYVLCQPTLTPAPVAEAWNLQQISLFEQVQILEDNHLTPISGGFEDHFLPMQQSTKGYAIQTSYAYNLVKGAEIDIVGRLVPFSRRAVDPGLESLTQYPLPTESPEYQFTCNITSNELDIEFGDRVVKFYCAIQPNIVSVLVPYRVKLAFTSKNLDQTEEITTDDAFYIRPWRVSWFANTYLGAVAGGSDYAWVIAVPRSQSSSITNSVIKLDLELVPVSGTGLDTQYELRATGNNPIEWHGWKVTSYADALLLHTGRYGYNTWSINEQGELQHSALPNHYIYADGTRCYNNLNACIGSKASPPDGPDRGSLACPFLWGSQCELQLQRFNPPRTANANTFQVNTDPNVQVPGSAAVTAVATVYEIGNEIPVVGGMPYTSTSTSPINTSTTNSSNRTMIIALSVAIPVALVLLATISIFIYRRHHAVKKSSNATNSVSSSSTVTVAKTETAAQVEMSQV